MANLTVSLGGVTTTPWAPRPQADPGRRWVARRSSGALVAVGGGGESRWGKYRLRSLLCRLHRVVGHQAHRAARKRSLTSVLRRVNPGVNVKLFFGSSSDTLPSAFDRTADFLSLRLRGGREFVGRVRDRLGG